MPIEIIVNTIPLTHRARRAEVEAAVRNGIGDRPGEYLVEILAAPTNSSWRISIRGPHGVWSYDFRDLTEHDPGYIQNKIEDALPREVPTRTRVLCDDCLPEVRAVGMDGPKLVPFAAGAQNGGYRCRGCNRWYHPVVGYFTEMPTGALARHRTTPRCGDCESELTMYIEAVVDRQSVRYRCPNCNAYRVAQIPDAVASDPGPA